MADIIEAETGTADVFFLIAVIVAVVAAIAYALAPPFRFAATLLAVAVACMAFGLLAL